MVQLNLVAAMCPVRLYDIVDPMVSSELLVKSKFKFFWFDWTGWTVVSIGLSGFIAIDFTGSMIQGPQGPIGCIGYIGVWIL